MPLSNWKKYLNEAQSFSVTAVPKVKHKPGLQILPTEWFKYMEVQQTWMLVRTDLFVSSASLVFLQIPKVA